MKRKPVWPIAAIAVMALLFSHSVCSAQKCEIDWTAQYDPMNPDQDRDETNGPVPVVDADDMIGYSADGNRVDEDDIAATPLALAIFAKRGWKNQLVHFSYNNCPMVGREAKPTEHKASVEGTAGRFGYDTNATRFFDCQVDDQWNAAAEHAVEVIKSTGNGKKFYWIQAGPHEFAYRVLRQVKKEAPEKLQYVVLVSHSGVNNVSTHSIRDSLGEGCGHTLRDCLALDESIGYFYTSLQGGSENFGSKKANNWDAVAWMKTVDCDAWNFVDERFRKAQEMYDKPGLDASDAGMAYTLATGDPDGNFVSLTKWIDGWCPEGTGGSEPTTSPANGVKNAASDNPVFVEENGLVVMEAESLKLPSDWSEEKKIQGYMGDGYMVYTGKGFMRGPSEQILTCKVQITKTGTYEFAWHCRNGEGAEKGEKENDTWLKIDADEFSKLIRGKSKHATQFEKVHLSSLGEWNWLGHNPRKQGPDAPGVRAFAKFNNPGVYEILISGRSTGHTIDRLALWHSDVDCEYALATARPESQIVGSRGAVTDPTASATSPANR